MSGASNSPEVRHYIGAGYYLVIGSVVELGCDEWLDDEWILLAHMSPADGHVMVNALAGHRIQSRTYRGTPWSDDLEEASRKVYEAFKNLPGYVPWTTRGNSDKQNEARDLVMSMRSVGQVGT